MPVDSISTTQSETAPGKVNHRPKIFVVFYSTYLHIYKLALAIKKGVEKEGLCDVTLYQIAETLSLEVQAKIRAPPKPDVPIITPQLLREADGILFGFPTRYGTLPSQLKEFFDACGQLWATGGLSGKFSGAFVSTATQHGGQETSIFTLLTTLAHFGMMFVPLGYVTPLLNEDKVIMGGGPWGASMSAGKDGTRQPSEEELEIARIQGATFSKTVAQFHRNSNPKLISPKLLVAENKESEGNQASEAAILPGAIAVVPSIEKAEELTEKKHNDLPLAYNSSLEKVHPTETTSLEVSKGPQNEDIIEKTSEAIAPLSASKALADFNIEEKDDNALTEAVPAISSPNPEIPPIDVAPELKPKKVASNDKDTESLIEMSVIDNIFNEARNTFPTEMSKTATSNSKDKEINGLSETKAVESPSEDSKPNPAIVIAGVAVAAGASALASNKIKSNSDDSNTEVESDLAKPIVQPGINGEEKPNEIKESYFPPQENSLRVDNIASGAPGSDAVKSPDVESRGILASQAFNKDDPTNTLDQLEPIPVPVVEAENSEQIQESVAAVPRKKSSMMELPLPVTATEASGYKKKNLRSSTDNVLPPSEGEEINVATSQEGSQRKASTFARNSATNLRRFFKSLSIRGKPNDMA